MKLFDMMDANPEARAEAGRLAIAVAKMSGVPAYYRHPDLGYVREHPDGTLKPVEPGASRASVQTLRTQDRFGIVS